MRPLFSPFHFVCTRFALFAPSGIDYFDFADWNKRRKTMASLAISTITLYLCPLSFGCVWVFLPRDRRADVCVYAPNAQTALVHFKTEFVWCHASRMCHGLTPWNHLAATVFASTLLRWSCASDAGPTSIVLCVFIESMDLECLYGRNENFLGTITRTLERQCVALCCRWLQTVDYST